MRGTHTVFPVLIIFLAPLNAWFPLSSAFFAFFHSFSLILHIFLWILQSPGSLLVWVSAHSHAFCLEGSVGRYMIKYWFVGCSQLLDWLVGDLETIRLKKW